MHLGIPNKLEFGGDNLSYILDGKMLANEMMDSLSVRAEKLRGAGLKPYLTVVTTGDNFAGAAFMKSKEKMAKRIGIEIVHEHFDVLKYKHLVRFHDPIIYQTPVICDEPAEISLFTGHVSYGDMDGASMVNCSMLAAGEIPYNAPCTAEAVIRILDRYNVDIDGKHVCIIGRSNSVGRPLARMFERRDATITLCHSKTPIKTLYDCIYSADIIVSATGCKNVIDMDSIVEYGVEERLCKQTYIDVGISRDENGNIRGDIDPGILRLCQAYTPVPGGVGPVTTAVLMEHVIKYFERQV